MAPKGHEREVMYADIVVRRRAQQAPFPPLAKLADLWRAASSDKKWKPKTFEKGTVTAIIADFDEDLMEGTITLLISVSDPSASDATYANHVQRLSRSVPKGPNEGNEYSAHVVISLVQRKALPHAYACLIERLPTVSIGRIQALLNEVIGRACDADKTKFTYKRAGGQKGDVPYIPNITIEPLASEQFKEDIETGILNGLRFSKPAPAGAGTAMGPYLTAQDYELKVKVSKEIPAGERWKTIKAAMKSKSGEFAKACLYIKPVDAASATSVEFDTATGNLLGEAYVRKRRISPLSPLLRNGSDTIVKHLEAPMLKLLEVET